MRTTVVLSCVLLAGCLGEITDLGENPEPVIDPKPIFAEWSGCMTMTNFQSANMMTSWSTLITSDGKQCLGCHSDGAFGFLATDSDQAFFEGVSQHSALMAMYFSVDKETLDVVVNTSPFQAANSAVGHPKFNWQTNQGMTALTAFHAATAANTACEPQKMLD